MRDRMGNVRRALPLALLGALFMLPGVTQARLAYAVPTTSGDPTLYVSDDAGRNAERVVRGTMPAIAPDGTRLAYVRNATQSPMLEIADLTTTAIAKTGRSCFDPRWSPDGSALLCRTEQANRRGFITGGGLIRVDAATGAATTITQLRGWQVTSYDWAPDGTRVAYDLQRVNAGLRSRSRIIVASADGTTKRLLTGHGDTPVWGPTGAIAFTRMTPARVRLPGSNRSRLYIRSQIWTIPADGGAARRITTYRARSLTIGPSAAVWAPDGATVYGTIGGEDQSNPIAVDIATGAIRRVGPSDALVIAVSADGNELLVETGLIGARPRVVAVPTTGGSARLLVRNAFDVAATPPWRP